MNIGPIALGEPFFLLLLPVCCAAFLLLRRARLARLSAFAEPRLLGWLLLGPRGAAVPVLTLLAWLLIALAAAGPYLPHVPEQRARPGIDIAVVVDISPSMATRDVSPDRLRRARLELHDFLAGRGGDRVALIAFSGYAYRVLPLTHDLPLVRHYVDALDTGLTRHHGSNLVQALEYAAQVLERAPAGGRAIVLLSDGEVEDAGAVSKAADRLAARAIPVFALGLGGTAGAPVPTAAGHARDGRGELVISRLDRALLGDLAARSGGLYVDASADDLDWEYLSTGLARLERPPRRTASGGQSLQLYPWLLAPGLALLVWAALGQGGRPRPATLPLVLVAVVAFAAIPGHADARPSERAARAALDEGRYTEAAALYRDIDGYAGRLGEGAAAYRQGQWTRALAMYARAADLAQDDAGRGIALYNAATTLARMDRLQEALATLDRALELHPNHARAALNRDLLRRALAERRMVTPEDPPLPPAAGADDEAARARAGGEAPRPADTGSERDMSEGSEEGDGSEPEAGSGPGRAPMAAPTGAGPPRFAPDPGARGGEAFIPPGAVKDDPREVLRHRFMVMDAGRVRLPETQTW